MTICRTRRDLENLRIASEAAPVIEQTLVDHLDHNCPQCWEAVGGLAPFEVEGGSAKPPSGPDLPDAASPVVAALRTFGSWPPRRWLRPAHRIVLHSAVTSGGFIVLVVEEARRLACASEDPVGVLLPWYRWLQRCRRSSREVRRLAPAYARIQAHLADALRASGDLGRAKQVLDQSEATLNERPSPQDLNAVLCATRARLVEVENPHLARAFYELAIDRLAAPRFRSLRVDTLLDLAAWHLRHEDPSSALANLRRAERALGAADEPLLMSRLETYRAAVGFGFAAEAPRLERLAHLAGAVGHGARVLTIPPQIDPRAAEEGQTLVRRLAGLDLAFEARVGCIEIERLRERAWRDPAVANRLASVRLGLGSLRSKFDRVPSVGHLVDPVLEVLSSLAPAVESSPKEGVA